MSAKYCESIQKLKEKLLSEFEANPHLFDSIDVQRVKTDEWQLRRFILDYDSEDDAFNKLIEVLKWKKSYALHERTDEYFPKELYLIFGHEKYSRDKIGRIVTWNIENRYRKIDDFTPLIQQFLSHQLEKLDLAAGPQGWLCISDCSNTGYANVDMSMSKFRTDQLNQYPRGMQISLNVGLPWIMSSAYKVVKNFMDRKIRDSLIMVSRDQLTDYVDIQSIPECFGGKRGCTFDDITHFTPLKECKHLGLNEQQIEMFYNTYKIEFSNKT